MLNMLLYCIQCTWFLGFIKIINLNPVYKVNQHEVRLQMSQLNVYITWESRDYKSREIATLCGILYPKYSLFSYSMIRIIYHYI